MLPRSCAWPIASAPFKLDTLELGGKTYALDSDPYDVKSPNKAGRTAGNAIGGALLGAIIGGAVGCSFGVGWSRSLPRHLLLLGGSAQNPVELVWLHLQRTANKNYMTIPALQYKNFVFIIEINPFSWVYNRMAADGADCKWAMIWRREVVFPLAKGLPDIGSFRSAVAPAFIANGT